MTIRSLSSGSFVRFIIVVLLVSMASCSSDEAANRNQSINKMKMLSMGVLTYADRRRSTFPAHAIYSEDGKPLLSWRVNLLRDLDEPELYRQFHLNEPWDSPHNRELIARMPDVFKNPNLADVEGKTNYLAVVGEPCIFTGTAEGTRESEIRDDTSKTIMFVEADADQAVIWTKPEDWQYDPANPMAGLGGLRPNGWQAAFANGVVRFIPSSFDRDVLKGMFTRDGGETFEVQ